MDQNTGQIKVIVVGDSGVGKSSLLLRFVNDEFNEFNEPTLGAAFVSKIHNYGTNKTTRFQVPLHLIIIGLGHSRSIKVQINSTHLLSRYLIIYKGTLNPIQNPKWLCVSTT